MPGDEILAVNNYRLDRLEMEQIVELLNESKQKPGAPCGAPPRQLPAPPNSP